MLTPWYNALYSWLYRILHAAIIFSTISENDLTIGIIT